MIAAINRSIIQGSGLSHLLYSIVKGDLYLISIINLLFKYADDTNLIVPENTNVCLLEEFDHMTEWARKNKMIINMLKTKEIVFRRPSPRLSIMPPLLNEIDQVAEIKLLGVIFRGNFNFESHIIYIMSISSQRIYLIKLLRDQGLRGEHLETVFRFTLFIALVMLCLLGVVLSQLNNVAGLMLSLNVH